MHVHCPGIGAAVQRACRQPGEFHLRDAVARGGEETDDLFRTHFRKWRQG